MIWIHYGAVSFERRFQPQSGFVKVTCTFNIRGEYFKARYFSIPLAYCFFTNNWLASLCHYIMCAVKYKFTSKTGCFESYDSHQLLCGGVAEVNSEPFRIAWFGKRLYIHPGLFGGSKLVRFDWFLAKNQSGCCRFDPCFLKARLCSCKGSNLKNRCLALLFCRV